MKKSAHNNKNKKIKLFAALILPVLLLFSLGKLSQTYLPATFSPKSTQLVYATPTPFPNHVVNLDSLATLSHWQKGVIYSAKVTSEYRGKILKIDNDGGMLQEYGWAPFDYVLKITVEGEDGHWNDIFLNKSELAKTVFKKIVEKNQEEIIDYKDLKANDRLQAFITMDLTKDFKNNFVSAEIIKVSQ